MVWNFQTASVNGRGNLAPTIADSFTNINTLQSDRRSSRPAGALESGNSIFYKHAAPLGLKGPRNAEAIERHFDKLEFNAGGTL